MSVQLLDQIFPYLCVVYGAVMTVALNSERLGRLADERFSASMIERWRSHRILALLSLFVGAAWVLQNLWLSN